MYIKNDTLSTRIGLHDQYSVNKYGWGNWVFDQYAFHDGMKILELACGTAAIWRGRGDRLPKNSKIVLSDLSPLMVQKARELLSDNFTFSFEQIDIQNIPYGSDSFDTVIANHMLYHVPDKDKALSEVYRVLKSDGFFMLQRSVKIRLRSCRIYIISLKARSHFHFLKTSHLLLKTARSYSVNILNTLNSVNTSTLLKLRVPMI